MRSREKVKNDAEKKSKAENGGHKEQLSRTERIRGGGLKKGKNRQWMKERSMKGKLI